MRAGKGKEVRRIEQVGKGRASGARGRIRAGQEVWVGGGRRRRAEVGGGSGGNGEWIGEGAGGSKEGQGGGRGEMLWGWVGG